MRHNSKTATLSQHLRFLVKVYCPHINAESRRCLSRSHTTSGNAYQPCGIISYPNEPIPILVVLTQQVCDVIAKYYPLERFPQKTLYALEEIINEYFN